jgi:hypothetical protein
VHTAVHAAHSTIYACVHNVHVHMGLDYRLLEACARSYSAQNAYAHCSTRMLSTCTVDEVAAITRHAAQAADDIATQTSGPETDRVLPQTSCGGGDGVGYSVK